jgi:hypothetical protein
MTATQLLERCQKRGIELFLSSEDASKISFRGPAKAITPQLLQVLFDYREHVLPLLSPDPEWQALAEEGQRIDADLAARHQALLLEAIRAAEAGEMPCNDPYEDDYDPAYVPIRLCQGTTVWHPGRWLKRHIADVQRLQHLYGDDWKQVDRRRPMSDHDPGPLAEDIWTVVTWWYDWTHRPKVDEVDEKGNHNVH